MKRILIGLLTLIAACSSAEGEDIPYYSTTRDCEPPYYYVNVDCGVYGLAVLDNLPRAEVGIYDRETDTVDFERVTKRKSDAFTWCTGQDSVTFFIAPY